MSEDRKMWIPDDTIMSPLTMTLAPNLWWLTEKIKKCHELGVTGKGVKFSTNDTGGVMDHPGFSRPPEEILTAIRGENPRDRNGHGTATSFITNQIIPDAEFITIKVLGDRGSGTMNDINRAYKMAADKGCHFINCSYGDNGGPPISSDLQAMQAAYDAGVHLIVVAAGNAGFNGRNSIGRPASYDEFSWCQGATDRNGRISGFSSGGKEMDAACYGQDMPYASPNGGYSQGSGTSFACPYQVGVFGLLWQARRQMGMPDLIGPDAWKKFVVDEGFYIDAGKEGVDHSFGIGLPAIERMLDWIIEKSPENL